MSVSPNLPLPEKTHYVLSAYLALASVLIYDTYFSEFKDVLNQEEGLDTVLPYLAFGSFIFTLLAFTRPHLYLNNLILHYYDRGAEEGVTYKRGSTLPFLKEVQDKFWGRFLFLVAVGWAFMVYFTKVCLPEDEEESGIRFLGLEGNDGQIAITVLLFCAIIGVAYDTIAVGLTYRNAVALARLLLQTQKRIEKRPDVKENARLTGIMTEVMISSHTWRLKAEENYAIKREDYELNSDAKFWPFFPLRPWWARLLYSLLLAGLFAGILYLPHHS